MVKLTHLLVLSALIVWLAGSGCVGNNTNAEEAGIAPNVAEAENGVPDNSGSGLTQAEIQELDDDMVNLEELLQNASAEEDIVLEEI